MKKIFCYISLALLASSCSKQLELDNPNVPTIAVYWRNANDAVAGTNAIYNSLIQDGTYMRMYPALNDGRGDDFYGDSPWGDLVQVGAFIIPSTSGPVAWVWGGHFQIIWRANQVLANVPGITMDEELKKRLLGQAYFLRGLAYFNLACMFKKVPVITTPPASSEEFFAPTAKEEVLWDQIVNDFKAAKERLPNTYAGISGVDAGQLGRATRGGAAGMLGKAYLYRKNWQAAADEFQAIIGGTYGAYSLMANYRDNFKEINENNAESLFEVQFGQPDQVGGTVMNYGGEPNANWKQVSSTGRTYAMDGYGYSDFLPSRWIYNEFKKEATTDGKSDPRLLATIASYEPGDNATTVYGNAWPFAQTAIYPRKYTHDGLSWPGNDDQENSGINYRVLRYADVLLMHAEALNELTRTSEAYPFIQQVRNRAKLPDLATTKPGLSQGQMRDQIAHERALEFAIESIRINDIIRWGWLYDATKLAELKTHDNDFTTWKSGKEYLPIPQAELDTNKYLEPNPAN
ncbi:Starch-binding associating with outer membrane [Filimonas lacunae]|uniref:Starch-binding associating with outer membrane n=1 Tax=Filimonas lacunae TaxID=477680 RepID=A0A173MD23_9BACT|nr:RagB/SusD family nutrient uptake outer membrane protein [Filimonas lacunae]BAV05417.1 outer membrane protein, nutrient binding [Filimonas lacunae]SIT21286.1 Starch-binding associating with outer membrane [Filimonas lacunae]